MSNKTGLIELVKQQAEMFLLDAGEFFPFGIYINGKNEIVPCSAYIGKENDQPESSALLGMLKSFFVSETENGKVLIGAIALDMLVNQNETKFDAIQIRFFEKGNEYSQTFKYTINKNNVYFEDVHL